MRYLLIILLGFCALFNIHSIENTKDKTLESDLFSTLRINNLPQGSTVFIDDTIWDLEEDSLIHLPLGEIKVQVWNKKYQLYTNVIDSFPNNEYSLEYHKKISYQKKSLCWLAGGLSVIISGATLAAIGYNIDDPYSRKSTYMVVSAIPIVGTGILMLIPAMVNASKYKKQRDLFEMKMRMSERLVY